MFVPPIVAVQSNSLPQLTLQQTNEMELSKFLRKNGIVDFQYDKTQVDLGAPVNVISKKFDTKVATGTISKNQDGKYVLNFIVEDTNTDLGPKQQFENQYAGIAVGIKLKSSRTVTSKGLLQKMPNTQFGIRITLELDTPGKYEIVVCFTPVKAPPPPKKKNYWDPPD